MENVNEIPKSPGIYELNGKINYCMNLQKKAKRCKGDFKVIKIMPDATEQELQNETSLCKSNYRLEYYECI